jgi:hypothetical protein
MVGTLLNSTTLDSNGRQLVLDDTITSVFYYDASSESWDKAGQAGQSWARELQLPTDLFREASVDSSKWNIVTTSDDNSLSVGDGEIRLGVESSEGGNALSSEGLWKLSGDFDIRLYVDLSSYYNEYSGITSSYLKVAKDGSNALRICLKFDGEDKIEVASESTIGRDLLFFDWLDNGVPVSSASITSFLGYKYFRIVRDSGILRTYISDGSNDVQVGADVDESSLTGELFVEFGVEAKEFNTVRTTYTKFILVSGETAAGNVFPSQVRGERVSFPDTSILAVDNQSLSIIDASNNTLWLRTYTGLSSPIPDTSFKVSACDGTVYCTTNDGLVAFDFPNDVILKYKGTDILRADLAIAARNSSVNFTTFYPDIGDIQSNTIYDVTCGRTETSTFVIFTNDYGVVALRPTTSGVYINNQASSPGDSVHLSEEGNLYWSSYDSGNDDSQLSVFSGLDALSSVSTLPFSRDTFYTRDTAISFLGNRVTSISTANYVGTELVALGSTVGITFIGFSPGTVVTEDRTYGILPPPPNPVSDSDFSNYLGLDWLPFYRGSLHQLFSMRIDGTFVPEGSNSLRLEYKDTVSGERYQAGTILGVEQLVDFTGIETLFFDVKLTAPTTTDTFWRLEILAGDTVLKSYNDTDGPFERLNDSLDLSQISGTHNFVVRLRILEDVNSNKLTGRVAYITNFKTLYAASDFPILSMSALNVKEVLLQYEETVRKIYFSSAGGYGAIDLDRNNLDYFISSKTVTPTSSIQSADFVRLTDEL